MTTATAGRLKTKTPGVGTVYRWELFKLRYQKRTYLGLGAAAIVPILFVVAIHFRHNHRGGDFAFSSYLTKSGLAVPLVILLFGAIWMFPLITALVAGDIFASEDHNGTLKTVLTRSLERWQIFAGKGLAATTYAIVAIFLSGTVGSDRRQHPVRLQPAAEPVRHDRVGAEGARARVRESPRVPDPDPDDRVRSGCCSRRSPATAPRRSSGTLMVSLLFQLIGILPGLGSLQPYLLSTQFNAWQGLLRTPIDWSPIVRAAWVCALYGIPSLGAAYLVFLRRDVAGG